MIDENNILENTQEVATPNQGFINPLDPQEYIDSEITHGFSDELAEKYNKLIRTHKQIIRAKYQGAKSFRDIAKVSNNTLGSVQNSLKNPDVQEIIAEMLKIKKQDIKNEMLYHLSDTGKTAILTLQNLMVNAQSETIKCRAAQVVLDLIFKTLNGQQVTIKDNNILVTDKLP